MTVQRIEETWQLKAACRGPQAVVFFPRPFGGRWALIHRPVPSSGAAKANMWLSFSPDLRNWGDHRVLLEARDGAGWDAGKIG